MKLFLQSSKKVSKTKEEKDAFHKEMTEILINAEAAEQKNVTERWKSDMASDNILSKSVRPLTLIFVIVSTVLLIFVDSGFSHRSTNVELSDSVGKPC